MFSFRAKWIKALWINISRIKVLLLLSLIKIVSIRLFSFRKKWIIISRIKVIWIISLIKAFRIYLFRIRLNSIIRERFTKVKLTQCKRLLSAFSTANLFSIRPNESALHYNKKMHIRSKMHKHLYHARYTETLIYQRFACFYA